MPTAVDFKDPDQVIAEDGSQSLSDEAAAPIPWSELKYRGSFAACYLMFEYQSKLLVIDQHAFHERILYEN